ncbi:hypothetical protein [Chryseobacterium jejuense]|nr:hypothetical protein [Chryseobacterium jejuense]SQB27396.1 Uncharacterised protein [Chryseobacterium jejuense]
MNKTDTVTMNHSESIGMIKTSSVIGDSQVFITGKLTEFIEGDVHSEVKQERNEISRKEMNFSTEENFTSHTKSSIHMNSGEKGHNH